MRPEIEGGDLEQMGAENEGSGNGVGYGARDWSRTSTSLRTLEPESSASTNSATRARATEARILARRRQ